MPAYITYEYRCDNCGDVISSLNGPMGEVENVHEFTPFRMVWLEDDYDFMDICEACVGKVEDFLSDFMIKNTSKEIKAPSVASTVEEVATLFQAAEEEGLLGVEKEEIEEGDTNEEHPF